MCVLVKNVANDSEHQQPCTFHSAPKLLQYDDDTELYRSIVWEADPATIKPRGLSLCAAMCLAAGQ